MSISIEGRGQFVRRAALATGVVALLSAGLVLAEAPSRFPGIGRPATPAEIRAWDIDVRKDFTGLPRGARRVTGRSGNRTSFSIRSLAAPRRPT